MTQPGLLVARIGKPHGLRGEVTVQVHTDVPQQRLRVGAKLHTPAADAEPFTIETVRVHQGRYLIGFAGVSDRNDAERLRNTKLYLDVGDASPQAAEPPGTKTESAASEELEGATGETAEAGYYEADVVGMQVLLVSGEAVGIVAGLHTRPAQDLLEISRPGGGQVLVPFVAALVPEVDTVRRRIVIDPPAGLLDMDS